MWFPSTLVIVALQIAGQSPAVEADIKKLGEEGRRAFEAQNYTVALENYRRAERLLEKLHDRSGEHALLVYLIGVTLAELGDEEGAARELTRSLALPLDERVRPAAESRLSSVKLALRGRVELSCTWPYAQVSLEGSKDAPKPCSEPWMLDAGSYQFSATQPDGSRTVHEISVRSRETVHISVAKSALAAEPVPPVIEGPDRTFAVISTASGAVLFAGAAVAFGFRASYAEKADRADARYQDEMMSIMQRMEAQAETARFDGRAERAGIVFGSLLAAGTIAAGLAVWQWLEDAQH